MMELILPKGAIKEVPETTILMCFHNDNGVLGFIGLSTGQPIRLRFQFPLIDDGASACITNNLEDFAQLPQKVICKVKGIEGHAKATH